MALSILGLKVAWEKLKKKKAAASPPPTRSCRIEGIYEVLSGPVKLALGNGHQGIQETAYGTYRFNKQK